MIETQIIFDFPNDPKLSPLPGLPWAHDPLRHAVCRLLSWEGSQIAIWIPSAFNSLDPMMIGGTEINVDIRPLLKLGESSHRDHVWDREEGHRQLDQSAEPSERAAPVPTLRPCWWRRCDGVSSEDVFFNSIPVVLQYIESIRIV